MPMRASRPSTLAAISIVSTSCRTIRATIRPTKKIRPAPIRRGRKAKISVTSSLIGREDLADAEELQRGHDADQPDDQLGDGAELMADGFLGRCR